MPEAIYEDALATLIPVDNNNNNQISIINWIKLQLKNSKSGFIKIDTSDLKNALGPDFAQKKDSTIYEAMRYVMAKYNIKVGKKKAGGGLILIMSNKLAIVSKDDVRFYR